MRPSDSVLLAALVVLALLLVYHFWWRRGPAGRDGFAPAQSIHQPYPGGYNNPYTVLNNHLSTVRGYRNDGYNQPAAYRNPSAPESYFRYGGNNVKPQDIAAYDRAQWYTGAIDPAMPVPPYKPEWGLDRYHRAGADIRPEQFAAAERSAWYAGLDADGAGQFNTELTTDAAADTMQYHHTSPAIDYDTYITDLITDPRTRDNHRRWVEEMKPWSGTTLKVDTLDMEPYIDFIGLRRPQPVVQYNPQQLTEITTSDLSVNPKFNFRG